MCVSTWPPQYESFVVNQVKGLREAGQDIQIFARRRGTSDHLLPTGDRTLPDASVHFRPTIPSRKIPRLLKAAGFASLYGWRAPGLVRRSVSDGSQTWFEAIPFLTRRSFDIIHCQHGTIGLAMSRLIDEGFLNGRLVTAVRGSDLSSMARLPESAETLFRKADRILPVSESLRGQLERLGCPPEKLTLHRSGIDIATLQKHRCKKTRVHSASCRVICVGRLVEKKGIDVLIDAVSRINQTVTVDVIGDGPLRGDLEAQARRHRLDQHVTFSGWQPHDKVLERVAQADILVSPSRTASDGTQEGVPNVLKEAMALGTPVIATRHAGTPELITDRVHGFLVPENDCDALAMALDEAIATPESLQELTDEAIHRVASQYDSRSLNESLIGLYHSLVTSRSQTT